MKWTLSLVAALSLSSAIAQTPAVAPAGTPAPAPEAPKPVNRKGLLGDSVAGGTSYYGMAGCGLGSVLFGESENRGAQILASTTNGVYSNNTFGMSSGTSNCVQEKAATSAEVRRNVEKFVTANREALANDIARREGDNLVAMSTIMGCNDQDYLGAKLQANYAQIFDTKTGLESEAVLDVVSSDVYLTKTCKL